MNYRYSIIALITLFIFALHVTPTWATKKTSTGAFQGKKASILRAEGYTTSNFSTSRSNIAQNIDYLGPSGSGRKLCNYLRFQKKKDTTNCFPLINKIENSCFISIYYAYDGKEDKYPANVRHNEVAYFTFTRLNNSSAELIAHIYSVTADSNGNCSKRNKISSIIVPNYIGAQCVVDGSGYQCKNWQ